MYYCQMTAFIFTVIERYDDILRKFLDIIYFSLDTGDYVPIPELSRWILDGWQPYNYHMQSEAIELHIGIQLTGRL